MRRVALAIGLVATGAVLASSAAGGLPSRSNKAQALEPKPLIAKAIAAEKAALGSLARGKTKAATSSLNASVTSLRSAFGLFKAGPIQKNLSKAIASDKLALKNIPSHVARAKTAINAALKVKAAALAAIPPDVLSARVSLKFFGSATASTWGLSLPTASKANEFEGDGEVEDEDQDKYADYEDDDEAQARVPAVHADRASAIGPIDALKFVVPPQGASTRQIIAFLCPTQLPTAHIVTTASPNDTLVCDGGSMSVGDQFRFNIRTFPDPTAGMGGQFFLRESGVFKGPFPVTGP